jgi:preprotein translocase subunit SecG
MDASTATVIGAVIAAAASIMVAIITSRSKSGKNGSEPELPFIESKTNNLVRTSGWLAVVGFYILGLIFIVWTMAQFSHGYLSMDDLFRTVVLGVAIFIPAALIHVRLMR